MGWSQKRKAKDGSYRYRACYRDVRGRIQSAGTFSSEREANRAWQAAEVKVAEGRVGDPRRGRQSFKRYVEHEWLPNHVIEPSTREGYTYQMGKHIMPWFGGMKMVEILPSHVREWVTHLRQQRVSPKTIQNLRNILSAVFTTALNDQVTFLHPCKGVKTPTVPVRPPTIIGPEQFNAIYQALPDDGTRLLVETAIETGLRWGELIELRPHDIDLATRVLTVSRAAVQIDPKFHPDGKRFLVKPYPKEYGGSSSAGRSPRKSPPISTLNGCAGQTFSFRCGGRRRRSPHCGWSLLETATQVLPNRTPRDAATGTAHSAAIEPGSAVAAHAPMPTRPTAPAAAPPAAITRASPGRSTPTGISPATGSAPRCGSQRIKKPGSAFTYRSKTSATPMRPGCSLAARTCRS